MLGGGGRGKVCHGRIGMKPKGSPQSERKISFSNASPAQRVLAGAAGSRKAPVLSCDMYFA